MNEFVEQWLTKAANDYKIAADELEFTKNKIK